MSGVRVAATQGHHLYTMAVLYRAHVVCVLCVCVAAPCCWAALVCDGDASECARLWLTPLGMASTKRFFFFLMMPKRWD